MILFFLFFALFYIGRSSSLLMLILPFAFFGFCLDGWRVPVGVECGSGRVRGGREGGTSHSAGAAHIGRAIHSLFASLLRPSNVQYFTRGPGATLVVQAPFTTIPCIIRVPLCPGVLSEITCYLMISPLHHRPPNMSSVDGIVLTRQGVLGLIILVLVCVPLTAVCQGPTVPSRRQPKSLIIQCATGVPLSRCWSDEMIFYCDACYDRGSAFRLKCFLNLGAP